VRDLCEAATAEIDVLKTAISTDLLDTLLALDAQERAIVALMASGFETPEIATRLGLSIHQLRDRRRRLQADARLRWLEQPEEAEAAA
jgi:hypothetical protein